MNNQVSLYLHIPFCIKRCTYCDFITHTDNSSDYINSYVEQVCREIGTYKNDKLKLKTIFFGGGTPSVLRIESLEKIFSEIYNIFSISDDIESTIEINPVNLNRSNLKKYKELGLNRLSMGVQSFNPDLLKLINRNHSVKDIYKTYEAAREAGFNNYNLDLIFGLPYQDSEDWEMTLNKAMELKPEHISLYGLDLHDNTPLFEQVASKEVKLPEEEESLKMFEYARSYLNQNNYIHYEISNWCRPGYEARHNLSYWKNEEYIGVGVSAASFYQNRRYTNTYDINEYMSQTDFFHSAEKQEKKIILEETVFMGLRLLESGISLREINKRFGIDFEEYYQEELASLIGNRLIEIDSERVRLTKDAVFISNEVFSKFIKV